MVGWLDRQGGKEAWPRRRWRLQRNPNVESRANFLTTSSPTQSASQPASQSRRERGNKAAVALFFFFFLFHHRLLEWTFLFTIMCPGRRRRWRRWRRRGGSACPSPRPSFFNSIVGFEATDATVGPEEGREGASEGGPLKSDCTAALCTNSCWSTASTMLGQARMDSQKLFRYFLSHHYRLSEK